MNAQHARVAEVLDLLASEGAQLAYQRNVPISDVAAELRCMWFDDLGEVWRSDQFTQRERDRLERFHQFYSDRLNRIPKSLPLMHRSPVWQEVSAEAARVLDDLAWHRTT
jgi:hypothetical protein